MYTARKQAEGCRHPNMQLATTPRKRRGPRLQTETGPATIERDVYLNSAS